MNATARPFGDDYADPRSSEDLEREAPNVRKQVEHLVRLGSEPEYLGGFVDRLQDRRTGTGTMPVHAVARPGAAPVFVAARRFVARRDGLAGEQATRAAELGYSMVDVDRDHVRLHIPHAVAGDADSAGLCAALRDNTGIAAEFDHVVPLGPVMKAEGGPEPSSLSRPFPSVPVPPGPGVAVAVIDTGISLERRTDGYLVGLLRPDNLDPLDALPFPGGDNLLDAAAGHGSFVAGVVQQVAPSARIRAYRVTDPDGICTDSEIAATITRAVSEGAQIVNLSLGTTTVDDKPLPCTSEAIRRAQEEHPDVLFVAAAGNDGQDTGTTWPAGLPGVVAVAGLTAAGEPSTWSSRGDWVTCSVVGEGVVSTYVRGTENGALVDDPTPDTYGDDSWASWTGTSFAAPQIVGALARRCHEHGGTPAEALAELLKDIPVDPQWGAQLHILPGTPTAT